MLCMSVCVEGLQNLLTTGPDLPVMPAGPGGPRMASCGSNRKGPTKTTGQLTMLTLFQLYTCLSSMKNFFFSCKRSHVLFVVSLLASSEVTLSGTNSCNKR